MKTMRILVACVLMAGSVAFAPRIAAAESEGGLTQQLQEMVATLSTEQQAALYLLLSELTKNGGEPAAAAAPAAADVDYKTLLTKGIEDFFAAATAGDDEAMMSFVSDSFTHYLFGDKAGLKTYLADARGQGYLDGIKVDTSYAEFKEADGKVTVYPVDVQGSFGLLTFEYVLQLEDGNWRIVEMDVEGL